MFEWKELEKTGTSSGFGPSYWTNRAGCPMRAKLDKENQAQRVGGEKEYQAMDVGSFFHFACQAYHSGTSPRDEIVAAEPQDHMVAYTDAINESRRLFGDYSIRFTHNFWGKPLATELLLQPTAEQNIQTFGVPNVTGQLDLVTEIDVTRADILNRLIVGGGAEPGVYIIDYKTRAARSNNWVEEFNASLQFSIYAMLLEQHLGKRIKGIIPVVVVKHKKLVDDSYFATIVQPPDEYRRNAVRRWLQNVSNLPESYANLSQCVSGYSVCRHLTSGVCGRI